MSLKEILGEEKSLRQPESGLTRNIVKRFMLPLHLG